MKKIDWKDPEQVKEYDRLYYLANREKRLKQMKRWRENHKEEKKALDREYHAKNITMKFFKYVGVCECPICGRKGYKSYYRRCNKKTGHSQIFTRVFHHHKEDGKNVHDGVCYIGMGEL